MEFKQIKEAVYELPKEGNMRVPVRFIAEKALLDKMISDRTVRQAKNVASLPGIIDAAYVMPDGHEGYGFPIGGVAAFDLEEGIVSPGGVGYDINCLNGDSKIMLSDGSTICIKELEKHVNKIEVSTKSGFMLFKQKNKIEVKTLGLNGMQNQEVLYFMKKTGFVYSLKTRKGFEIKATFDHPFLTPQGMKALGLLKEGEKVAIYEQEVEYDEIIEKTPIGIEEVFDITVDKNHNFIANGFVVSNCGVRLIRTNLSEKDARPKITELIAALFKNVPTGVGSKSKIRLSPDELEQAVSHGVNWAVEQGHGVKKDTENMEENGCMQGGDYRKVSDLAKKRGGPQLGTLGSGNHFIEVQRVERIFDEELAKSFGVFQGQITVMIHSGSRGYGHQVCDDFLKSMLNSPETKSLNLTDRELCSAPISSQPAQDYLAAMKTAINFAFCNRHLMMSWTRESFEQVFKRDWESLGMDLLYDVCHNIAKIEEHKGRKVCVHRKGATRAFWKGMKEIPEKYRNVGQPVIIPGSMNTASYLLCGMPGAAETFGSSCHGAGRVMSRHQAMQTWNGRELINKMRSEGMAVQVQDARAIAEEAGGAYKDVDAVVKSVEVAGISKIVARMVPLGVIKG